jgi:NMD protein affecting ribosome stability and mRNA decay
MANTTVLPIKQQDAVVVSLDTHEVQILDPETYDTVTVSAPQPYIMGDTISIVKWKGVLYLVGD